MIHRGEIWWALLPDPRGSEPGYRRPILVVQSDDFSRSAIRTVVAVVITGNRRLAQLPGNVFLSRKASGLPKPSVANVSQVITVDKSFLEKKVKRLPKTEFAQVEAGMRLVLQLH